MIPNYKYKNVLIKNFIILIKKEIRASSPPIVYGVDAIVTIVLVRKPILN